MTCLIVDVYGSADGTVAVRAPVTYPAECGSAQRVDVRAIATSRSSDGSVRFASGVPSAAAAAAPGGSLLSDSPAQAHPDNAPRGAPAPAPAEGSAFSVTVEFFIEHEPDCNEKNARLTANVSVAGGPPQPLEASGAAPAVPLCQALAGAPAESSAEEVARAFGNALLSIAEAVTRQYGALKGDLEPIVEGLAATLESASAPAAPAASSSVTAPSVEGTSPSAPEAKPVPDRARGSATARADPREGRVSAAGSVEEENDAVGMRAEGGGNATAPPVATAAALVLPARAPRENRAGDTPPTPPPRGESRSDGTALRKTVPPGVADARLDPDVDDTGFGDAGPPEERSDRGGVFTPLGARSTVAPLSPVAAVALAGLLGGGLTVALAAALYHRIARSSALSHPIRERLYAEVDALGRGATAGDLGTRVGVDRRAADYHLTYLARLGMIRRETGPDRASRFSPLTVPAAPEATPVRERIVGFLRANPGATAGAVAEAIGVTRTRVERRVKDLVIGGRLETRVDGGTRRIFVSELANP